MSLATVSILIMRPSRALTETLGVAITEAAVAGSPFAGRVYRVQQTTSTRDEAKPGAATIDAMRRISLLNPDADVRKGDIAYLASDDDPSATERALIVRVRRYADRVQCDVETGAEQG